MTCYGACTLFVAVIVMGVTSSPLQAAPAAVPAVDTIRSDAIPLTTDEMKAKNLSVVQKGFAGMAPLSEEEIAERMKNWNKVVQEYELNSIELVEGTTDELNSQCNRDIRAGLHGCKQLGTNWCWATGVASAVHFFNPEKFGACTGLECQVVGHVLDPKNPSACCPHETRSGKCDSRAGYLSEMVDSIQWALQTPEPTYTAVNYALSLQALDVAVSMEAPVYLEIGWYPNGGNDRDGGHIIWVGGCTSSGNYWVHNPGDDWGSWTQLSYWDILHYKGIGRWEGTVHLIAAFSTCGGPYSKGCGTRDAEGPDGRGRTCTNCGCSPCDAGGYCYACTSTSNKCFTYHCGTYCSTSPCSSLPAIDLKFMVDVTGEAEPIKAAAMYEGNTKQESTAVKKFTKIQSETKDSANSTMYIADYIADYSTVIGAVCASTLAISGAVVLRSRLRVAAVEETEYGLLEAGEA